MHTIAHGILTPPTSPHTSTPPQSRRCPPTPESRIGIFLGQYLELKTILGTGAYGVVYAAFDHLTQTWYAVKALSKTNANGEPLDKRQREFQSREIRLHYMASAHPNIVSVLKIVDDPECTYVVLDYCPEGDLFSNITERGRYVGNDALVRQAFLQILDAVEHCHRLGIYHRDLKPENILVSNAGNQVLLADFGLATTTPVSEDHGCGSTFYMSPECLDQSSRNASYRCAPNDVWSLGVILVNLTCGRNPWKQASVEDSTYKAFTRNRDFLKTILPLSDEVNDILGMIFESDPRERINVSQLKQLIYQCSSFSAPVQQALPTPPQSPCSYTEDIFENSLSDDGSVSDDGSLTGSCSTVSDTDSEASYDGCDIPPYTVQRTPSRADSGYESVEESLKPESESAATVNPEVSPRVQQRPAAPAPCTTPSYVLPQPQEYTNPWGVAKTTPSPNPWYQPWSTNPYEQQYEQVHAVSHVQSYPHPAFYAPHYQYAQSVWV
ncbi:related to VHS1-protein kinase involved in G1/S transition [Phialocephala subalpina]|uniref:Autophagy-related protein 1 n=1 Tax=Phialocephala subalpina TaxID=576137 RepID=A0A1L7X9V6_9HELO|nr:related to VHS1-protein kinase involved in G1/S transition [Phialocephala subalpina]